MQPRDRGLPGRYPGRLRLSWRSGRPRSYDRRTLETPLCPMCEGPVPAERPPNRSWTTMDCPHCGSELTWVGVEQSTGWQIIDSAAGETTE
jgi:hypothetical protein